VLVKQGATHIWRTDVQETEDQIGDTVLAKFTIPGVSAREAAWYFWSLSTRKEWDGVWPRCRRNDKRLMIESE
jgi:hypothetical protein